MLVNSFVGCSIFVSIHSLWWSFAQNFPLSSSRIILFSKHYLGVIGWVPTSLIDSRHNGLCAHTKKEMSKLRRWISQQRQRRSQNPCLTLLPMVLETLRSNNNDERSFFQWVDSFRIEMAQFEAIFHYFQKTLHKFFKNWTFDIGLSPPKYMKYNVFRHEKM
jgi:hypothetical protein